MFEYVQFACFAVGCFLSDFYFISIRFDSFQFDSFHFYYSLPKYIPQGEQDTGSNDPNDDHVVLGSFLADVFY
jgi:hypothetical protein